MTSLVGTSGDDFGAILKSLGYAPEARPGPAITVPLLPARPKEAATVPVVVTTDPTASSDMVEDGATSDADEPSPGIQDEAPDAPGPHEEALVDGNLEQAADEILAAEPPEAESGAPEGEIVEDGATDAADEPDPGIQDEPSPAPAKTEASGLGDARLDAVAEPAPEADAVATGESAEVDERAFSELDSTPDRAPAGEVDVTVPVSDADAAALEQVENVDVSPPLDATAAMISDGPPSGDLADAAADRGGEPVAAAEPETIQVWRLQRFQREHHPRGRHGRRNEGGGRPAGGDRRPEGNRAPAGEPGRAFAGPRGPGGGRGPGAGGGPGGSFGRDRGAGGGGPRPAGEGRGPELRSDGQRRDERPRPPRERDERPRFDQRPQRRERQPDPDSPFAKLASLKAQLEGKDREGR